MALPQGQAGGSPPAGDPSPSEGSPGPSRAPPSPAAARQQALRELKAQVQAAYGQVKGTSVWGCPHLRAPEGAAGIPHPTRDPVGQTQAELREGPPDVDVAGRSAAQEGGWRLSPPLPSLNPCVRPAAPRVVSLLLFT